MSFASVTSVTAAAAGWVDEPPWPGWARRSCLRNGVAQPPLSEHAGSVTREQVFHFGLPLVWVDGTAFDNFGQ
jgi:hypothetical protein